MLSSEENRPSKPSNSSFLTQKIAPRRGAAYDIVFSPEGHRDRVTRHGRRYRRWSLE